MLRKTSDTKPLPTARPAVWQSNWNHPPSASTGLGRPSPRLEERFPLRAALAQTQVQRRRRIAEGYQPDSTRSRSFLSEQPRMEAPLPSKGQSANRSVGTGLGG